MLCSLNVSRCHLASVHHNQDKIGGGGLDLSHHSVFVEPLHEQTLILVWILKPAEEGYIQHTETAV